MPDFNNDIATGSGRAGGMLGGFAGASVGGLLGGVGGVSGRALGTLLGAGMGSFAGSKYGRSGVESPTERLKREARLAKELDHNGYDKDSLQRDIKDQGRSSLSEIDLTEQERAIRHGMRTGAFNILPLGGGVASWMTSTRDNDETRLVSRARALKVV